MLRRTLRTGTTTCCYYGSLHADSTLELARICAQRGQRAFVGKVCMDRHGGQDYQEASHEESLDATKRWLQDFQHVDRKDLVRPILTPRFAICCSKPLLDGLGDILRQDPCLSLQTCVVLTDVTRLPTNRFPAAIFRRTR